MDELDVARQLARDLFEEGHGTALMRKVRAEPDPGRPGRWKIRSSNDGPSFPDLEVTRDALAYVGLEIVDGKLATLTFDDLLERSPPVRMALALAKRSHAGQTRKHGPPYIEHPIAVARRLWESVPADVELCAAGLLHDTLEDTALTGEEIRSAVGERVLALAQAVTKPEGMSKAEYLAQLVDKAKDAQRLKIADRTENLRDLLHHPDPGFAGRYVEETERFLLPIARTLSGPLLEGFEDALKAARAHARR